MLRTMDEEMHDLQSAQSKDMGMTQLPNQVTMWMSRKRTIHKSQILFGLDTLFCNTYYCI